MKLVAMMVVRNEWDRYLEANLRHLMEFCDEIRILDDASDDGWNQQAVWAFPPEWEERVKVMWQNRSTFYQHEGQTRQTLLEWTMDAHPTHILAIDADEFVADGQKLRAAMEEGSHTGVWKLTMTEIWAAGENRLAIRQDGAWKPRPVGIAFAVPELRISERQSRRHWRMNPKELACGRTPLMVTMAGNRTITEPVTEILHFGWACKADRAARYERYVEHDGGKHHASKHLLSIMWGDDQVQTSLMKWPPALDKDAILARANRT